MKPGQLILLNLFLNMREKILKIHLCYIYIQTLYRCAKIIKSLNDKLNFNLEYSKGYYYYVEQKMGTCSSIFAWKTPWTKEDDRL